jgi:hypothetical protein
MSGKASRIRVSALVPQNVDKYAITALCVEPVNCLVENSIVIHGTLTPVLRRYSSILSPIIAEKQKIQRERLAIKTARWLFMVLWFKAP